MLKLISYLKPYILHIIIIVALLGVQASCDLSLPEYMSHIMNIGIEKNGIENAVPKVIRENQMHSIKEKLDEKEYDQIIDNYSLVEKGKLLNHNLDDYLFDSKNPMTENVYVLNDINDSTSVKLNNLFTKAIIADTRPDSLNTTDFQIIHFISNEYAAVGISLEKVQTHYILRIGGEMLLIALVSMLSVVMVCFIAARLAAGVGRDLRQNLFTKVMNFSNSEFDRFSTASLITRTTNDIQQIQSVLVIMLRMCFYAPIMAIGGVFKVMNTESAMTWIIGVAVAAVLIIVISMFSVAVPKFKLIQQLVDKLNLVTREALTGIEVIRAFGRQDYEEKRFDKANIDLTKINLFVNRVMAMMNPLMSLVMNITTIVIIWFGAKNIQDNAMQVGDMMAFIQYAMQIIMSFLMLSMVSIILPRAAVSADRIGEILDTEITVRDAENPLHFDNKVNGKIEFRNVYFRYPEANENVLEGISFVSEKGKTTAIIGGTGSGKSTLINLIPRFYDVTQGEILIDNRDIRKVKQAELRSKIGYVPQKSLLFSGTIESNIKYGGTNISDDQMIVAADIAQAVEFISSKENVYDSKVSQGGNNFSGGQKQRLSIARALAKTPEIFIFDDSFSALDYKTDANLRKALFEKLGKNATILIVSQRISTIRNAEQIIVLDAGKIVGKGTHNELIKTCEVYKQIAQSQLQEKEVQQ